MNDRHFQYLTGVADYLESFLRRTRPLEDPDKIIAEIESTFAEAWEEDEVTGWSKTKPAATSTSTSDDSGDNTTTASIYCDACQNPFSNKNVFDHHTSSNRST